MSESTDGSLGLDGIGAWPPGWYPTAWGWRWWDGQVWGPMAPAPPGPSSDTTLAALAHISCVFGGVVLAGVLYAISDDKPFVRTEAREALNANITFLISIVALFALGGVGLGIGTAVSGSGGGGAGVAGGAVVFVVAIVLYIVGFVAHIVFGITGAVRASRGEHYRYPFILRLVKG